MHRAPGAFDLLFDVAFFYVFNGAFIALAWRKARTAAGAFRWLYFLPMAPLVVLVCRLSWDWLFDVTADNLWPLGMAFVAVPCMLGWMVLMFVEARAKRS